MTHSRRVAQHSAMTPIGKLAGLVAVLALVAACGPTAQALHPTLAPHGNNPVGTPMFPALPSGGALAPTPQVTFVPGTALPSGAQVSTAPAASATPQPAGIGKQITGFPVANAFEVTGVVPIGDGFLAVGYGPMPGQDIYGQRQGIIWTSTDGLTWQESADPTFANTSPFGVATLGSDIFVFTDLEQCDPDVDPECEGGEATGIFKSSNGGPWVQLQQTPDIQQASFDRVVASDGLLIAWGNAGDEDGTPTVWTSSDGLAWTPATDLAGMDPVDSGIAGGPGVIAFGLGIDDQGDQINMIGATSSDGVHFTAATVPALPDGEIDDIAQGNSGFVGVGYNQTDLDPTVALVLTSGDGRTWTQAAATEASFADTAMNQVLPSTNGYVAVGSLLSEDDFTDETTRVWTSPDGQTWHSAGDVGGSYTQYDAGALGTHGLVIFTADQPDTGDDTQATSTINAWLITPDRLTP
jgi:hypothetical protein